jgi:hypothetical protein
MLNDMTCHLKFPRGNTKALLEKEDIPILVPHLGDGMVKIWKSRSDG